MSGTVGFRIARSWQRPSHDLIERFKKASPAQVADSMSRFGAMDTGIKPVWRSPMIVGAAVTVWVRSADNLMLHKAMEVAQPGDVVVVNTQGNITNSGFGELMANTAARAGISAVIVDGTVRDGEAFEGLKLPVYARGLNPNGCDKTGPGEIGYAIACGGVAVHSGDIVLADGDGVTVVPLADAEAVAASVEKVLVREAKRLTEIADGLLYKPEIDDSLRKAGVIA